jgi:hypothetical protein
MNGFLIGWGLIGCAALLLGILRLFPFGKDYSARDEPAVDRLREAQVDAMERGEERLILVGNRLSPLVYPGLGLHALAALPAFLDVESGVAGGLTLGSADGALLAFARQIVKNRYRDGFSPVLHQSGVRTRLFGPTPLSFTAGVLPKLCAASGARLALFGHYGPEAMLWAEGLQRKGGQVFASGGALPAQAALFLTIEDQLIGESNFILPWAISRNKTHAAGLLAQDILRWALILGVLIGAGLKLGGIL